MNTMIKPNMFRTAFTDAYNAIGGSQISNVGWRFYNYKIRAAAAYNATRDKYGDVWKIPSMMRCVVVQFTNIGVDLLLEGNSKDASHMHLSPISLSNISHAIYARIDRR